MGVDECVCVSVCVCVYTHVLIAQPTHPTDPRSHPTHTHIVARLDISLGVDQYLYHRAVAIVGNIVQRSAFLLYK